MAAEAPLRDLVEEATCSVCLDLFQDPVLIPGCGHNFCRGCLTRSWGTSESEASCPQCRQTFPPRSLLPNGQLARVLEVTRRCVGHAGEEGGSFCPKHREPLKLFCKHHETLICVVCDRSKEHRGHSVIPAEEAFLEYQEVAMASEGSLQDLVEEATCSICLDFFQDPVLILVCGHNFCQGCLTRSWGKSESEASCPQCRQTFALHSIFPNRQLARMVEAARRCEGPPRREEGGSFCPKHREPLKLFCKDHETLICVVCDRSKDHRGHWVVPPEEAFLEYQIKVEDCLKAQKEEKEKIATYKRDTEQTVQEMLDHIEKVKKSIVAEFRELQLLLEGQVKPLLTRMEETEKDIMARKEKGLAKHMEDLCSLDHLIQEIEEKHQQPASKLLQDIGSILKKYQAKETYENPVDLLLEPKWTIWDYSDITAILKSAMKKFRDALESGLQLQEVNVILDPDTANARHLNVSEDQKSVKGIKPVEVKHLVANPNRFVYKPCVLGCQTFSTGRHFWEVMIGDRKGWGVGVAKKPLSLTNVDIHTKQWEFGKWEERKGKYTTFSPSKCSELVLTEEPTRIRISLNCEEGQVSFFDARTSTLLHTFSDASLVGETLLPYFFLREGSCLTLL